MIQFIQPFHKKRLQKNTKSKIGNERGLAMIETLPILVIFIVLLGFGLGMFGFVHTAILNSIGARTYAMETLQHRADVTLFRDRKAQGNFTHYARYGTRFHVVDSEKNISDLGTTSGQYATDRNIAFGIRTLATEAKVHDHNVRIYEIAGRNRQGGVEVSPAWVMVGYGICINAQCGD